MRAGDRLTVVSFDGNNLHRTSGWASSREEIRATLRGLRARPGGLRPNAELTAFDGRQRQPVVSPNVLAEIRRLSRDVISGIRAAELTLRAFAEAPGRNVMLLASGGWPTDAGAYLYGYPTDMRQLSELRSAGPSFSISRALDRRRRSTFAGPAGRSGSAEREVEVESTLLRVAEETGGVAMVDGRRDRALGATLADVATYYWLGFASDRAQDDKVHEIDVSVRGDGLKVRSRRSFRDSSARADVEMAVESGLLFADRLSGKMLGVGNRLTAGFLFDPDPPKTNTQRAVAGGR